MNKFSSDASRSGIDLAEDGLLIFHHNYDHAQYHLGPEATVQSFTCNGEDGVLMTTPGPCLSDEQIDETCVKSCEMW
ncbi:hypothetical protein VTJ83DRAFT_5611 [Remersonia thermophila]|uniref:Uncharacterized protein n=1 Tax=Remersonia thermophila TaxID=72144 RepID=A0ABR4D7B8_9PEZI